MIDMRAKLTLDYTQGMAIVRIAGKVYTSHCTKCREFDDFDNLTDAYIHAMNHHNLKHRL